MSFDRALYRTAWVTLVILLLLIPLSKVSDFDIFFHLRLGQEIHEQGALPRTDTLSYTSGGSEAYNGNWLSELLFYEVYTRAGGWVGLAVLKGLIFLLVFYFLYRTALLLAGDKQASEGDMVRPHLMLAALALTALAIKFRLNLRPYYFTYLGLAVFLYAIERRRSDPGSRLIYALPVVEALWSNAHGGSIMGPALMGLFLVSEWIERRAFPRDVFVSTVLVILAGGLNPEGFHTFRVFLALIPLPGAKVDEVFSIAAIDEWAPLDQNMLWGAGLRYTLAFQCLAAGALGFIIREALKRRVSVYRVALFSVAAVYAARHVRLIELSSLIMGPMFYALLTGVEARLGAIGRIPEAARKASMAAVILLVVSVSVSNVFFSPVYSFGLGTKEMVLPERAASALREVDPRGNAFNTIPAGSYLLFNMPERKVFIDGRLCYPGDFIMAYYHALGSADAFAALDSKYGFGYAIAEYGQKPSGKFPMHLGDNPDWALVSWDQAGVLWIKRGKENAAYIDKHGYSILRPTFNKFDYLDAPVAIDSQETLSAIDHDIALDPGLQEAHLAKVYAAYYAGFKDVAFNELKIALSLPPDTAFEHISMAQMLIERGDTNAAVGHLERARELEPYNPTPAELLKRIKASR